MAAASKRLPATPRGRAADVQLPAMEFRREDLRANAQTVDWGYLYVRASHLTERTQEGAGALIFILDTGIADHEDLDANRVREFDRNFTADTAAPHPHGTHCAGIAAAANNSTGIIGVAPRAGLVDVQVLDSNGSGSYQAIASAIRYVADLDTGADSRRRIISMSLGGPSPNVAMHEAIQYAIGRGVIVVAAAGNSGYTPGSDTVGYPGAYPEVITVAALDPDGDEDPANQQAANYSSAGPAVDIAAPGTAVLSTVPGGYARFSGTSMACPHVAGICALLATADPQLDSQEKMEARLLEFAIDLLEQGKDVRTGMGAALLTSYLAPAPPTPPAPPVPVRPKPVSLPFEFDGGVRWATPGGAGFGDCEVELVWRSNLAWTDAHDLLLPHVTAFFAGFAPDVADLFAVWKRLRADLNSALRAALGASEVFKIRRVRIVDSDERVFVR